MKISIIVPAFNEERLIAGTLRCIDTAASAFKQRGWSTELIVCDNNSTDRTAELARAAGAQVVFEQVNQIGRARNRGAEAASGDWLLFVDADSQPDAGLFDAAAAAIETGCWIAGGSTVKMDGPHLMARFGPRFWNWISRRFTMLAGSFIFCDAAAFRHIGGFSNELFAGEEIDLSKRLIKLGRETDRGIVILDQNPLLTSARKVHLYTLREHAAFVLRTLLGRGKTLNDRASCHTWYDGRR
jgi:glycosyltransferase involved in cell wall biosynthesis